jgi:hypothetical protein
MPSQPTTAACPRNLNPGPEGDHSPFQQRSRSRRPRSAGSRGRRLRGRLKRRHGLWLWFGFRRGQRPSPPRSRRRCRRLRLWSGRWPGRRLRMRRPRPRRRLRMRDRRLHRSGWRRTQPWRLPDGTVVAVRPRDQVRRRSARPVNLDDHALAVLIANVTGPDHHLVALFSVHPGLLLVLIDGHAASGLQAARSRGTGIPWRGPGRALPLLRLQNLRIRAAVRLRPGAKVLPARDVLQSRRTRDQRPSQPGRPAPRTACGAGQGWRYHRDGMTLAANATTLKVRPDGVTACPGRPKASARETFVPTALDGPGDGMDEQQRSRR